MFTPSLGLFETLHHARLATLDTSVSESHKGFPYSPGDFNITFFHAWEPFKIKTIQQFLEIPLVAVLSLLVSTCILRIFASSGILKFGLKEKFCVGHLMQGLHSFIAPALQFDWEFFYRRDTENETVLTHWRR